MAVSDSEPESAERPESPARLTRFTVEELFGYLNHTIEFPQMTSEATAPEILIIEGQNGTGKTTILKMIAGIIDSLNFDTFRHVPFKQATLELSTGEKFGVIANRRDLNFPIIATFGDHRVPLARDRSTPNYNRKQLDAINAYRAEALPLLGGIDFELLTIDRAIAVETKSADMVLDAKTGEFRPKRRGRILADRVQNFLREAQVNYRRFFQAEELELLPRILRQLGDTKASHNLESLLKRVNAVRAKNKEIVRFGLETDDRELNSLADLLQDDSHKNEPHALSLLASYVEIHENRSQARDLIALRLSLFESIMDDFFVGKKIRISSRNGFEIEGAAGRLKERDLSSGEFHFLYMMVAALLCERTGTIIAIDEPELSLHVSWQRRLIAALAKCASGASPLFFLSTHSTHISTAHRYAVQTLSAIDE
jgi:predicted ATPase